VGFLPALSYRSRDAVKRELEQQLAVTGLAHDQSVWTTNQRGPCILACQDFQSVLCHVLRISSLKFQIAAVSSTTVSR